MATVYLAQDLKHDRPVALKVLHPELAATLGPERFLREIRLAARLQHPHILAVLDSGEAAGLLWYSMPYVEGESLRDRLEREKQLPFRDALRITTEAALALDYAHRHGVVHRDIKPENILLSDDQALVADFGVARALEEGSEGKLTETGLAVGTPAYMSPEQASGSSVDRRSDVYSLGCVLYEMLAGEPPYTGASPQAIIAKRFADPVPSIRRLRETVPETVDQALMQAMAKAPADRFGTAAEFNHALTVPGLSTSTGDVRRAALNASTTAPAKPIHRRHVLTGVGALSLSLLLGLGVLFQRLHTPSSEPAGPRRIAVLPFENLGRPEDGYFADGVTDEVRGKLTALPGLEVIARASSGEYKETTKRPAADRAGVGRRLLADRDGQVGEGRGRPSRVRVSPELVQVSTASTKWQAPFEAPLTDVFRVQADVAARVAEALGLALGAGERERLAERPTENLAAYDAFLKGEEATGGCGRPRGVPAGARLLRARGGPRLHVRARLGPALASALVDLLGHAYGCRAEPPRGPLSAPWRLRRTCPRATSPSRSTNVVRQAYHGHSNSPDGPGTRAEKRPVPDCAARTNSPSGTPRKGSSTCERPNSRPPLSRDRDTRGVRAVGLGRYPEALRAADRGLALAPSNLGLIQPRWRPTWPRAISQGRGQCSGPCHAR